MRITSTDFHEQYTNDIEEDLSLELRWGSHLLIFQEQGATK